MTSFDSPKLPISQIVENLNEHGLQVVEDDFKKPDPRRWREIYAQMYEALTRESVETAIQLILLKEVRMKSSNTELFEEGAAQIAFTLLLRRVLSGCGYKDFSLQDVVQPTPKTVRWIASFFINRILHDSQVEEQFEKMRETAQKSRGEYESVTKLNKELKQVLGADEDKHAHQKAQLQQLEDEIEKLRKTLVELQEIIDEEIGSSHTLKLEVSKMELKKAELKQAITQNSEECDKLSRKIVQSPKKFQVDLDRLKKKLMDMKSQFGKMEQELSQSKLLMEQTMNKIDAAGKAVKLANETQADWDKDAEISGELVGLSEKHCELQEELDRCFTQEEDLQERCNVRQGRKYTLTNHTNLRQQSDMQRRTDLKGYSEKLEDEVKSTLNEVSTMKESQAQYKTRVCEIDDKVKEEKQDMKREEDELVQQVITLDELCEKTKAKVASVFQD